MRKFHEHFTNISQTRSWIRKNPRAGSGSGSEMTLQVGSGSGSEINSFGSATLLLLHVFGFSIGDDEAPAGQPQLPLREEPIGQRAATSGRRRRASRSRAPRTRRQSGFRDRVAGRGNRRCESLQLAEFRWGKEGSLNLAVV